MNVTQQNIATKREAPAASWARHTLGSLFLIILTPFAVLIFWYTNTELNGSFQNLYLMAEHEGTINAILKICMPIFFGSFEAWRILFIFLLFQMILMRFLPGPTYQGPITPMGNIPLYKANGVLAFITTLGFFYLGSYQMGLFSPTIIYDNFGAILGALNIFSLFFCLFLLIKGRFFPSSTDSGSSGNLIFDYYWGTELYPRICGWDVKMLTNCRLALMSWPLIILSFAAKQSQLYGISNSMMIGVALQIMYVAKFFVWETGYLRSLDIMHDRAGYYICWGCLVWVPGIYTSSSLYLVHHPHDFHPFFAGVILLLGLVSICINYWADKQRQDIRAKNGSCYIWGKKPVLIFANYTTEAGEKKQNILLASGWWGISRHFHYIPEILAAFFWTLPALFYNFSPWFYVIFLIILLTDRAYRDDKRCAKKYGEYWNQYCQRVPYKILPFVV